LLQPLLQPPQSQAAAAAATLAATLGVVAAAGIQIAKIMLADMEREQSAASTLTLDTLHTLQVALLPRAWGTDALASYPRKRSHLMTRAQLIWIAEIMLADAANQPRVVLMKIPKSTVIRKGALSLALVVTSFQQATDAVAVTYHPTIASHPNADRRTAAVYRSRTYFRVPSSTMIIRSAAIQSSSRKHQTTTSAMARLGTQSGIMSRLQSADLQTLTLTTPTAFCTF